MKKRMLAAVLALVMLVSVLPVALAEDVPVAKINETAVEYDTLQAALDAATAGQTVTLLQDTQENVKIEKPIMGQRVEMWNDKLPQRDWALLETGWANAYTGNGGEVN